MRDGPVVRITAVEPLPSGEHPVKFSLDVPRAGDTVGGNVLELEGWAFSEKRAVLSIQVSLSDDNTTLRKIPVWLHRPDVKAAYPRAEEASNSGFSGAIGMLGTPVNFTLVLRAALKGEGNQRFFEPVALIHGERRPLEVSYQPRWQPILLTTMGRHGSTWMMRLLSEHPQILIPQVYPYEIRVASYWMHAIKVLSDPADHRRSMGPDAFELDTTRIGHNPYHSKHSLRDLDRFLVRDWFEQTLPQEITRFAQATIDNYYTIVAECQNKTKAVYFVEKISASSAAWLFWEVYDRAREIVLVRDFRYAICSARAFNTKRGFNAFGREHVGSDEAWIKLRREAVARFMSAYRARRDRAFLLKYEDLVLDRENILGRLLRYLDVDDSVPTIGKLIKNGNTDSSDLKFHRTTEDARASVGRWRQEMDENIKNICRDYFRDFLDELGYPLD